MNLIGEYNRTVPFHWSGSKKWMAPIISRLLPKGIKRLLVGFFGRGDYLRLVRNLGVEAPALVSDIHPKVMVTHEGIRQNPGEVVRLLGEHQRFHSPEYFIQVRDSFDLKNPKPQSAAAFCYMMNGSYKACLKERKNGEHTNISARRSVSCQPAAIYAHAIALRNTSFFVEDFEPMLMRATAGDFALIDPPYYLQMGYGGIAFGKGDHQRLACACREIDRRGCRFLLTINDHPYIRDLYRVFDIEPVVVPRNLGPKRWAEELTICNYAKEFGRMSA